MLTNTIPNSRDYSTIEYFLEFPTYFSSVTGGRTADAINTWDDDVLSRLIHFDEGTTDRIDSGNVFVSIGVSCSTSVFKVPLFTEGSVSPSNSSSPRSRLYNGTLERVANG